MFILYNIVLSAFLLVFSPLLILFVLCSSKYRDRIPARLGAGIGKKCTLIRRRGRTFWLHALSVGEVTSAAPLVRGLREKFPDSTIIITTTTRTGKKVAETVLGPVADCIIDGPLDLLPVVRFFIRHIQPDMYILVETDFWPNILYCLGKKKIPAVLVNGRISEKSMSRYWKMKFFFRPMFLCFRVLAMQTRRDREKMEFLGISPEKLPILGNLKFASRIQPRPDQPAPATTLLPGDRTILIAGSTHPGEERILIDCYIELRKVHPDLFLVLAPRDPGRAMELVNTAAGLGLTASLRSTGIFKPGDIFILDTIGELLDFYALADLAFVGGSLVQKGGHNPVEPAAVALPVLFGRHMEDFSEIAETLVNSGGAIAIDGLEHLTEKLAGLLSDKTCRTRMGQLAQRCVRDHHDIVASHLDLIEAEL